MKDIWDMGKEIENLQTNYHGFPYEDSNLLSRSAYFTLKIILSNVKLSWVKIKGGGGN